MPLSHLLIAGNARFSVLTPGLLRLEYALDGVFEDRATFFAVDRKAACLDFKAWNTPEGGLQIETARLRLSYAPDGKPFHAGNLSITVLGAEGACSAVWNPGMVNTGNLGGTLRTLDEVQGPVPLEDGILSRSGWTLKDDSATVLLSEEAKPWPASRPANGQDWYFFGYGLEYAEALASLTAISGKVPLPPRYALGSWYSRYWPYSADEFLEIADEYAQKRFPLDVMVIDMDWHQAGWTGYTWNQGLIPDPEGLLRRLHEKGLRTTLNLHPHQGVGPHEQAYPEFARAMGLDPAQGLTVPFDVTSRDFMANYFDKLIHPLEEQGVDFWWMDWQQGTSTVIPGLDPLMWLNQQHYRDSRRPRVKGEAAGPRGMAFSRFAGLGDHRHPVHFSGDTHGNWEVLQFLSHFTASAGNVGVAYWSHDLGGHFSAGGRTDAELYLRWLQFGAVSPIMRLHSSRDPLCDRRPWVYDDAFADAARKAFDLHAQLLPYFYTLGRQCYDSGLPLLRPMYLHYAREDKAYQVPDQFMLGQDLLVAPVARPGFGPLKVVHVPVWFPEGDWYHLETHERFCGPLETVVAVPWDSLAIFARGGAPIPMQAKGGRQMSAEAPALVRLYPGPEAVRELYQDDGLSAAYEAGAYRKTLLGSRPSAQGLEFFAGGACGSYEGAADRQAPLTLEVPGPVTVSGRGLVAPDADGLSRVPLEACSLHQRRELALSLPAQGPLAPLRDQLRAWLRQTDLADGQLEGHSMLKGQAQELHRSLQAALDDSAAWKSAVLARHQVDELQRRMRGLLRAVNEAGAEGEAAFRVLAGVSLQVQVQTRPGGKHRLEVELRRSAEAVAAMVGTVELRWRLEGREGHASVPMDPGRACVSVWDLDLELDRQALAWTRGQLELEMLVMDARTVLRESFAWDGRTVKDWQVMGPLKAGTELVPAKSLAELDLDASQEGDDGSPRAWTEHAFDPSRVARGLRHFYDLGNVFQAKDAVCLAASVIEAAQGGSVDLELHHIGKARLWLNGREVYTQGTPRFRADLQQGSNLVQIRLQDAAHEGLGIHLAAHELEEGGAKGLRFRSPKKRDHQHAGRR